MGTVRRIAKNTGFLFLSNFIQKIFSLALVLFIAQKLGVNDFGVYSFVFSFVILFTTFSELGVGVLIFREISKSKERVRQLLGDALSIKFFLSTAVFLIIAAAIFSLNALEPQKYPRQLILLTLVAALSMLLDSFAALFRMVFFAFEKMEYDFYANMAYKGFLLVAAFSLLFLGFGLWEIVLATLVASAINLLTSFLLCTKKLIVPKIEFNFRRQLNLVLLSVPFCMAGIFSSIYGNIDMFLLSLFRGTADVAYYSAATRLVNSLSLIPATITTSIFPVMALLFARKDNSLSLVIERISKYLLMIILPVAFGTTLLAARIIGFFYPAMPGNNFAPAALALQILVWFSVFGFVNLVFLNALNSTAFEKRNALIFGLTVLVNIIANLLLIPPFGFAGAAASMVISEAVFFILAYSAISKRLCKINFFLVTAKPFVAAIAMSAFIHLFFGLNLFLLAASAAVVYFIALLFLQAFDENDFLVFRKIIKNQ